MRREKLQFQLVGKTLIYMVALRRSYTALDTSLAVKGDPEIGSKSGSIQERRGEARTGEARRGGERRGEAENNRGMRREKM